MAKATYEVLRPADHPGPGVLRLLLKGTERRMERGGTTVVELDEENVTDLKALRDLRATGYEVKTTRAAAAAVTRAATKKAAEKEARAEARAAKAEE